MFKTWVLGSVKTRARDQILSTNDLVLFKDGLIQVALLEYQSF
jgi:hypothetical protein